MNAPDQSRRRILAGLCTILAVALCLPGCKPQGPKALETPSQRLRIFAPPEMEPYIRAAETIAQSRHPDWRIDLLTDGAQTLAWSIEAGEVPDLYIASTTAMAEELLVKPTMINPWLQDRLVVLARADDPDPILHSERALERSTGAIAVGGDGFLLGDYTRLALRYAELWLLVESRTLRRSAPEFIFEALRNGDADLAIVFASDAAQTGTEFSISQWLDLPENAGVVFTQAAFTDFGAEFADILDSPEILELARQDGYNTFIADENPRD